MAHKSRLPRIYLIILAMMVMLVAPQVAHAAKYNYVTYTDPGISVTLSSYSSIDISVAYNLTQVGSGQPADQANTIEVQWVTTGSGWGSPSSSGAMDASQPNAGSYSYPYHVGSLSASTSYDIRVIHTDLDGVGQSGPPTTATTSSITQSTGAAPANDTTVDTLTSTGQTDTTVSLQSTYSGDANDSNSASFDWSLAGQASWNAISGPSVTRGTKTWTVTASGLLPGTSYDFRVTYTDGDGVTGSPKTLSSVSTTYTGLGVGTVSTGATTANSVVVNAPVDSTNSDTNNNATVQYQYKLNTEPTVWTNFGSAVNAKTNQSIEVTGLTSDTLYNFRVVWTDANGVYNQTTKASLGSPYTSNTANGTPSSGPPCVNTLAGCTDCHNMPPVDYAGGDPTGTTRRPGNHDVAGHTGAGNRSNCAVCHYDTVALMNVTSAMRWDLGHSNNVLDIFTTNNLPNDLGFISPYDKGIKGGYYKGLYTSIYEGNQPSSVNVCTGTYCHGAGDSPVWGQGTTTCTSCHNTPPAGGKHGTHSQGYIGHKNNSAGTNYDFGCFICHSDTANHASGPVSSSRAAIVNFGSFSTPMNANGSYAEGAFVSTDNGFDWTNGTCSNLYCHSDAKGGNPNTTPTWNGSMALNCAGCHNGLANAVSPMSSGKHTKHISSGTYGFGCEKCHNDTTTSGTGITDTSFHVNSSIDVAFDGQNPVGSHAGTTCSTMYCHGDGVTNGSADWTGGATTCNSCHNYTPSSAAAMATNMHDEHISNGNIGVFECNNCHSRTVASNNTTILYAGGKHVNVTPDVAISFNGFTGVYQGDNTCTSTYCHSSGQSVPEFRVTPAWTGAVAVNCDSCHGADNFYASLVDGAPDYENISTSDRHSFNSHNVGGHVAVDADCAVCHDLTVDTNKAIIPSSQHLSGSREVNLAIGSYDSTTKRCSNTDCHGTTTMRWGGKLPESCYSCHTDQGAGTNGTHAYNGKHDKHTNTYGFACEVCHATKNTTQNTAHAKGDVSTNHAAQVFFNVSASVWTNIQYDNGGTTFKYVEMDTAYGLSAIAPTYTPWTTATPLSDTKNTNRKWTEGRCGNVWCHSNANPMGGTMTYVSFPNWSTAETTGCKSCHGGPEVAASVTLSETHAIHIGTDRYAFTCSKCHNVTVSSGNSPISNYTTHVNKFKDVDFDSTNGSGDYTSPNCTLLYCHGDGDGATGGESWSTVSVACTSCHDYDAAATPNTMSTGKHTEHIDNGNIGVFGCSACHSKTVDTDNATILYANGKHVDGAKTVAISFNSMTGVYQGDNTCRSTYCHSSGQIVPNYIVTPNWTSIQTVNCDSCHGTEGTSYVAGAPEYANVSTANRNTFNGHYVSSHVSTVADCQKCHNTTVDNAQNILGTGNHINGTRTVSFLDGGSYDNTTKRCSGTDNNNCHGASTIRWGGSATCIDCHTVTGTSETDNYVYGTAPKATINFEEWTSAGHGSISAYRYTSNTGAGKVCEDCHTDTVDHGMASNPFRLMSSATIKPTAPNTLCESCHSTASIKNHEFSVIARGTWTWVPKCVDCHDPHGDSGGYTSSEFNGAMIQREVSYTASNTYGVPGTTETIDFPANYAMAKSINQFNWSSFAQATGPGNKGICRVCHSQGSTSFFTRTVYDGTHFNDQGKCTTCHIHSEGFKPGCSGCHGDPPNLTDNKQDNIGAVGAHDKHVNVLGLSCYDCHKGNTHNQLAVSAPYTSLVNPSFVNLSVTSTYGYVGNKPTYNGTPGSWSPNKTCSNVGCHYGDSIDWDCQ